jgi:hypothetical protein
MPSAAKRSKIARKEAGLVPDMPLTRASGKPRKFMRKPRQGQMVGGATGSGWLPGQSGNKGGRPKGRTLLNVIRQLLRKPNGDERELVAVAQAYINEMKKGSFPHAKEFIDREEGKVTQPLELSASGKPTYKVLKGVSPDEL